MKPIDISPEDMKTVRAFGSRVRWTARGSSDLDLVLMTEDSIDAGSMADLREAFTESDLPFKVDIVDWATTSGEFRRVIEEECEVLQVGDVRGGRGEWLFVKLDDVIAVNPVRLLLKGDGFGLYPDATTRSRKPSGQHFEPEAVQGIRHSFSKRRYFVCSHNTMFREW